MPLLRVENLTVRAPHRRLWLQYKQAEPNVLNDLCFSIDEGSITGLIGDTGSGKLALSMAIMRVEQRAQGAIYFDGGEENILKLRRRRFRQIQRQIQLLLPDELQPLNPLQTIGAGMHQLLELHQPELSRAAREDLIERALAIVDLPSATLSHRPSQMIAAYRQRSAIARAIAVSPKLLICHDITNGIDMTVQAEILNLLKDLRDKLNLTLFFITHDLAAADHMSDHILILNRGRIVESGTPDAIFRAPEHDYTRRLVASTASLH